MYIQELYMQVIAILQAHRESPDGPEAYEHDR